MHNAIEPPWYVTRMPGGVTGKAREGLPMSITLHYVEPRYRRTGGGQAGRAANAHHAMSHRTTIELHPHPPTYINPAKSLRKKEKCTTRDKRCAAPAAGYTLGHRPIYSREVSALTRRGGPYVSLRQSRQRNVYSDKEPHRDVYSEFHAGSPGRP